MIIDLHTHSLFSDGELCPAELVQRAKKKGYSVLGITDHTDFSSYRMNLDNLLRAKEELTSKEMKVLIGVEITHVPPARIESLVLKCRDAGAEIVVVHGETIVEPVEKGTNEAAIKSGADILAHPGFITEELVQLAAQKRVFLELSARRGSCLTNGYVAKLALKYNAMLAINSDGHSPNDLFSDFNMYQNIALGAGIDQKDLPGILKKIQDFVSKK